MGSNDNNHHQLILASQSPRRKELLSQLGYSFQCANANIDETALSNELPEQYVERLARSKAQTVTEKMATSGGNSFIVLGADTSVIIDNEILGKPENLAHCLDMLQQLSNRKHQVLTAIAVHDGEQITSKVVSTEVFFKPLTIDEITHYWHTGEPQDKAGAYGIQGIAGQFVQKINGSYSSVVGLPLFETAQLLATVGLPTLLQKQSVKKNRS